MSEDLVTMEPASAEVSIVERLPAEVSTVETVPTEVSTVEPTLAEVSAVEETVDEVPAVEEEPPLSESSIVQPAPVEITPVDAAPGEVIAAEPALAVVPTIEPAPAEVATTQPAPAEVATKEPTPSDVVPVEQAATVLEAVYEQGASEHVEPAQPKEQKEPDALEKAVSTVLKSEEQVLEAAEDVKKKTTKKKKKTSDVSVDGEKKKKKKKSTETKERPSYNMSRDIDYSKKIHVRSVDTSKVQKQFSQASDNQTVKICKLCERQVFQMEQVKAEKAVWHKNCFRCNECGKQIMLDTYESHEGVLYCKPHYKQLFQPKAHFEDPEPRFMRKKPEMIIRESQPVQLPPDVARASDKVDHGLDELNSVDLKSRFSLFERKTESQERDLAKSPSQVTVKKAEAILNKVARFQTNGSSHLPGSDSESEPDNEESDIIRSSKKKRERPQSFAAMGDVKQKFAEGTFATESAQRREEFEKEKKEELIKLRARLCAVGEDVEQEPHEQEVYRDPTVVRSDDKLQDELPKDTAKKALSIFKQMEMQAANPEALNGPKPLKRFTPPPGYTGGNSDDNSDEESEYESEEDEETDNDEDESENDVVKASDKIEDEFLKITSERAMAKNLRNKFERWEAEMEKENRLNHSQSHLSLYEEEGIEASLETTRDLKARFEALSTEPAKPVLEKPRIKVNRFV